MVSEMLYTTYFEIYRFLTTKAPNDEQSCIYTISQLSDCLFCVNQKHTKDKKIHRSKLFALYINQFVLNMSIAQNSASSLCVQIKCEL